MLDVQIDARISSWYDVSDDRRIEFICTVGRFETPSIMKSAAEYFDDGAFHDDDDHAAIESYSKAIQLNPEFAEAFFNRGTHYDQLGDSALAAADFKKFLELRPDEPTGHDYLASVYLYAEDPGVRNIPLALKHGERSCLLAADSDYHPHCTLAAAYAASGHFREAVTSMEKAIELASCNLEAKSLFVPGMKEKLAEYLAACRPSKGFKARLFSSQLHSALLRFLDSSELPIETLKIILLCLAAAIGFGIVHDQVTARVCVEYFSIGHPPAFHTDDPTLLGLGWGVIATWWMGLILSIPATLCSRVGSWPKFDARQLLRPIAVLLIVMACSALVAGIIGCLMAKAKILQMDGIFAMLVPPEKHAAFLADAAAHLASYGVGFFGGLVLCGWVLLRRSRLAKSIPHS
jgi:hypothetical protein